MSKQTTGRQGVYIGDVFIAQWCLNVIHNTSGRTRRISVHNYDCLHAHPESKGADVGSHGRWLVVCSPLGIPQGWR
jgi:hypothetical protein